MERLQKVMAKAGVASRRKCEELIIAGKVNVNGKTITECGTKVDPDRDVIEVNGKCIKLESYVYILLYKPVGVITSVSDPQGRKTVMDLLSGISQRVFPVGRLDYDTSGLLLLTNDGELTQHILHPRYEWDKVYEAEVKGIPAASALEQLRQGVLLNDGWTAPAGVRMISTDPEKNRSLVELTIHEGRNRQVRRMCKAIGHPVLELTRVKLGFLSLKGLEPGKYRRLTAEEIARLKEKAGL